MCNIHFIMPVGNTIGKKEISEMVNMLERSGRANRDGYGIFSDKGKISIPKVFEKTAYIEKKIGQMFIGSKFLVGHNRYITSGKAIKEHTHPLETENLMYVHNGHISNYLQIVASATQDFDSSAIGQAIEKEIANGIEMPKAMTEAMKNISGYLSVFVYHKPTKKLYYMIKGAAFEFQLVKDSNNDYTIIGDTSDENLTKYGSIMKKDKINVLGFDIKKTTTMSVYELYQNVIYEISENGIEDKGRFDMKVEPISTNTFGYENEYYKRYGVFNTSFSDRDDEQIDILKDTDKDVVKYMSIELRNIMGTGTHIKRGGGTGLEDEKSSVFQIYTDRQGKELLNELGLCYTNLTINQLTEVVESVKGYAYGTIWEDYTINYGLND